MIPTEKSLAECVQRHVETVRIALERSSPDDAVALARVARDLRNVPPSVHSEGQLFALAGICRYFQQPDRDNADGLEAAVLLGKRALALGRPAERLSALMNQALIHDELDSHLEALEAYAEARGVAADLGRRRAEVAVLVMAAQALRQCGEPASAKELATNALAIADQTSGVDDLCTIAWTTIAQWHLCSEEVEAGLAAVRHARASSGADVDPGLVATLDFTETMLRLLAGDTERVSQVLDALERHARANGTIGAALAHTAARGARDVVGGRSGGRVRLVTALEKARRVPRALPDILMAALVAEAATGDGQRATQLRDELTALFLARRTNGQLKATLMRGPIVGFGSLGKAFDTRAYERRFDRALRQLQARAAS